MDPRVRGDDVDVVVFLVSPKPCQSGALHLVSAPFGDPFSGPIQDAVVAQLVRAPVCGTGGRWFEPTQLYHHDKIPRDYSNVLIDLTHLPALNTKGATNGI